MSQTANRQMQSNLFAPVNPISPSKEILMNRTSIVITVVSLFAVLFLSACATSLTTLSSALLDAATAYAAEQNAAAFPDLVDRQALAEYQMTLPHYSVTTARPQAVVAGDFLADHRSLAEYQMTLPHVSLPTREPAIPFTINDRQELAEYQMLLAGGMIR